MVVGRWAGLGHLGLLLDGEGGGGEGVALAIAQLALLCTIAQDVVNVLHRQSAHSSKNYSNRYRPKPGIPAQALQHFPSARHLCHLLLSYQQSSPS